MALDIFQGNVIPVEQSLATRMHTPVTDVNANEQTSVSTVPVISMQTPSTKAGTAVVANYKKPYTLTRRAFTAPTILVKHGHKVQRVMLSSSTPSTMYNGQILNPSDTGDGDGYIRYTTLQSHSTSNWCKKKKLKEYFTTADFLKFGGGNNNAVHDEALY